MAIKLSEGAIEVIMSGGHFDEPIIQVLGSKKLPGSSGTDRYRLLISDGRHLNSFAMVASQLNDLITSGELADFTIVKITRFISSIVQSKRVMVILELDFVKKGSEVGLRIGNPVLWEANGSSGQSSSASTASVPSSAPVAKPPARTPVSRSNGFGNQVKMSPGPGSVVHPISSLNPYQNKWCIKARVTNKQPVRTYSNQRGEGKLFSVVFTDETGEIKCTGFNSAVDKFANILEVGKVYLVSNCSLKPANKKFTQADYEMTFNDDSQIVPTSEDSSIPVTKFNFTPINKIAEMPTDACVDVIGVAKSTGDVVTLIARNTGKELKKREVTLVDQSNVAVSLTLWGDQAVEFDGKNEPVVAAKDVQLNEFMGGKSLSVRMSSVFQINPDIEEAHRLRGWYDNGGASTEVASISTKSGGVGGGSSNWVLQGEIASQGMGLGEKADYFSGVVTVMLCKSENCFYRACPGQDCRKKVTDMNNGQYHCEKCNRDYDHFIYRLILSMQVSDYTGSNWVTAFNEEAEKVLGCSSKEIGESIDNGDGLHKEVFAATAFKKFQMKFRAKMEAYNDESRLKVHVVQADPIDYKSYARRLLNDFKTAEGIRTGH